MIRFMVFIFKQIDGKHAEHCQKNNKKKQTNI